MTFVLGLTGSIATGKSTVLGLFAARSIPVYSADAAVHEIYRQKASARLKALFPDAATDAGIDRKKLADALLDRPDKLALLEAVVHPLVREKALEFIASQKQQRVELCVLEIPLLLETAGNYPLDAIAVTWCDQAIQRRRALSRPGMTVEKLEVLLARQMSQEEKQQRADFLIDTGTSIEDTNRAIDAIVEQCRNRPPNRSHKDA